MIRLVIDPGVLISAAISPGGSPARLISLAREGLADLVVCPTLLGEVRIVLARPKLLRYLSLEQGERYVGFLDRLGLNFPDPADPPPKTRDPRDDYLIALALDSDAAAIVSGDRDLLEAAVPEPPVLSPREALARLERDRHG